MLPARGVGKTAGELALALQNAGFDVGKRQVERDLRDLQTLFALECDDRSAPFGWRWPAGMSADIPGMTAGEALSLRMLRDAVQPLVAPPLLQALQPRLAAADALLAALPHDTGTVRWQDKVRNVPAALALLAPDVAPEVLETVQQALLSDEQLEVDYRAFDSEAPARRMLHPLALIGRGGVTYLVACAWEYDDPRLYALHRIEHAVRQYLPARRPAGFSVDHYIAEGALQFGGSVLPITLQATLSPNLAQLLRETPLAAGQRIGADGRLEVAVPDTWQLEWWLLSQGDGIEVTGPEALRTRIRATLQAAAARYAPTAWSCAEPPNASH